MWLIIINDIVLSNYVVFDSKMEGGCDTGFRHVGPKKYTPRLLQFKGAKKNVILREVVKIVKIPAAFANNNCQNRSTKGEW